MISMMIAKQQRIYVRIGFDLASLMVTEAEHAMGQNQLWTEKPLKLSLQLEEWHIYMMRVNQCDSQLLRQYCYPKPEYQGAYGSIDCLLQIFFQNTESVQIASWLTTLYSLGFHCDPSLAERTTLDAEQ